MLNIPAYQFNGGEIQDSNTGAVLNNYEGIVMVYQENWINGVLFSTRITMSGEREWRVKSTA